jgi:hypothetical protein
MKIKTTNKTALQITTELAESPFGSSLPTLRVKAPREVHWRKVAASLHRFAAAVLEATPDHERWCVVVDVYGDQEGRVYLETMTGEKPEADRGMAVLGKVAKAGL